MTDHPNPIDLLAAYVDGELDAEARRPIELHLAECAECSADVAAQQQVQGLLRADAATALAPAALVERVRAGLGASTPATAPVRTLRPVAQPSRLSWPQLGRSRTLAFAGVLTLLILLGSLAAILLNSGPSPVAAAVEMSVQDHIMCEQQSGMKLHITGAVPDVQNTLAQQLGMKVATPPPMPGDYSFAGGHDLPAGTTTFAHMAWFRPGPPYRMLSLYQAPDPGGNLPSGWQRASEAGFNYWLGQAGSEPVILWRSAGMLYILAGDLPTAELVRLAQAVGD